MRNILYYPKILIPSEWIKKTILYSDKISSIYPYDTNIIEGTEEKIALSNMHYLKSLGLYEYTRPEELDQLIYQKIFRDFQNALNKNLLQNIRKDFRDKNYSYEIYQRKMNRDIIDYLLENKVAKLDDNFPNSILVEKNIGLLYMSLLAFHSSNTNKRYVPSTDQTGYHNLIFKEHDSSRLDNDHYLSLVMMNIPSPSPKTSLEEIIEFKKKRRKELLLFRKYLNEWTEKLQSEKSTFNNFMDDFELYNEEISSLMKSSGISIVGSSFSIVLPTLVDLAIQYITGNKLDNNFLLANSAKLTTAVAINIVKTRFDLASNNKNPLSYLHCAKNDGIL
jgi:hypothetical protein